MPASLSNLSSWRYLLRGMGVLVAAISLTLAAPPTIAQVVAGASASAKASGNASWNSLSPPQKTALKPLEREWSGIDAAQQVKWLEIANRFSRMPAPEQARMQNRMGAWARMTPKERGQARMNYSEAQQVPAQERNARWEAYKALSPDRQKQLAARAARSSRKGAAFENDTSIPSKSNVVPNSSYAPKPRAVAPTVTQAQPGATTNPINKRPSPPAHQQAGLPKIAATPGFVDQATLLPKRGPQGVAATRAAAASSPPLRP